MVLFPALRLRSYYGNKETSWSGRVTVNRASTSCQCFLTTRDGTLSSNMPMYVFTLDRCTTRVQHTHCLTKCLTRGRNICQSITLKSISFFSVVQNQFRFEGTGFSTIPQLIEHHFSTKQVITKKSGVVLLNPVVKVTACVACCLLLKTTSEMLILILRTRNGS